MSAELGLAGWPAVAEETIIARDVLLAQHTGARLHVCHLSTAGSVEVLRWAKARGIRVTAEVTPHHLLLTDRLAAGYDARFKVNPPAALRCRRRGAARRPRRRHHRHRRDRSRAARPRRQALRVECRGQRHGGPRVRPLGRAGGHGRDGAARLGGRRARALGGSRTDRQRGGARSADRGGRPRRRSRSSTRRLAANSRIADLAGKSVNSPVSRAQPARCGHRDVPSTVHRPCSNGHIVERSALDGMRQPMPELAPRAHRRRPHRSRPARRWPLGWRGQRAALRAVGEVPRCLPTRGSRSADAPTCSTSRTTLEAQALAARRLPGLAVRGRATVAGLPVGRLARPARSGRRLHPRRARSPASAPGTVTIDRVVEPGGMIVITWILGSTPVDTYLRPLSGDDKARILDTIIRSGSARSHPVR